MDVVADRSAHQDSRRQPVSGWGRSTNSFAAVCDPADDQQWRAVLSSAGPRGVAVRGAGCGYGDVAQNGGGTVARTAGATGVDRVDDAAGTVTVGGGATIYEVNRRLAADGWMLPVVPGTGYATVGGCIAADVHGKNHPALGSFAAHVMSLDLLSPGLGLVSVDPERDREAFWATAGGLGLTGVILRATLRVVPLPGSVWRSYTTQGRDLEAVLDQLLRCGDDPAIGWIDASRHGRRLGTGMVTRSEPIGGHAALKTLRGLAVLPLPGSGVDMPPLPQILNRLQIAAARVRPDRRSGLNGVLHPLDALPGWPRLHGGAGLIQYQFAVPFGQEHVLARALEWPREAGVVSTLASVKRFGSANDGPLSFPLPGWSLALDFSARAALGTVLDRLDELVADAGGRVYLVKDSRLRPDLVPVMYPRLDQWRAQRRRLDPRHVMTSDLDRRLHLTQPWQLHLTDGGQDA